MSGERSPPLETFLRHDRTITLLALIAIVVAAAWAMLASGHAQMIAPSGSAAGIGLLFIMWWMMMMAMMLPSAAPAILVFNSVSRRLSDPSVAPSAAGGLHRRLPRGVDRVQPDCRRGASGIRRAFTHARHDVAVEPGDRWRVADRRRHLAAYAHEGCLPQALPVTFFLSRPQLATGRRWGFRYRAAARSSTASAAAGC